MGKDCRLNNQEGYLKNLTLYWRKYAQQNPEWDHDHCEFCRAKFAEEKHAPDALHEGYTTENNYYWVCNNCFEDFKDRFNWLKG